MRASILLITPLLTSIAGADEILNDSFGGPELDPAWTIVFQENVLGWTYDLDDEALRVTDIEPETYDTGDGGNWARVWLERAIPATGDFEAEFTVRWSSDDGQAMQTAAVNMIGAGTAGHYDPWYHWTGAHLGCGGGTCTDTGFGSQSLSGETTYRMTRIGSNLTVRANDNLVLDVSDAGLDPVHTVRLRLEFYPYDPDTSSDSYFGTIEIDQLTVVSLDAPCPADLDADGAVTVGDLLTVLGAWGTGGGDVTGDGTTDVADLLAVLAAWGPCS